VVANQPVYRLMQQPDTNNWLLIRVANNCESLHSITMFLTIKGLLNTCSDLCSAEILVCLKCKAVNLCSAEAQISVVQRSWCLKCKAVNLCSAEAQISAVQSCWCLKCKAVNLCSAEAQISVVQRCWCLKCKAVNLCSTEAQISVVQSSGI
jgi:hypothetical protein